MFRLPTYWLAFPTAFAVSAALALIVVPEPGAAAGPDDGERYGDFDSHGDVVRSELEAQLQSVKDRTAYKSDLIDRLIAGNATLAEVTDEFRRLNRGTPAVGVIRVYYRGSSDEEKNARNVITFVDLRPLPADRKAEVLARLAREFEGRFGRPLTDSQ
jgi:hypothetical protein